MQGHEQHDEDARRREKKETKLFIHGNQRTSYDATAVLFNILAFLQFVADDAEHSAVYQDFKALLGHLRREDSRDWMTGGARENKHFIHTLIIQFQDIFAAYASLATNPIILGKAVSGGDIDLQVLKSAQAVGRTVRQAIMSGTSVHQFMVPVPSTWSLFSGEDSPPKKRKHEKGEAEKPKRGRNGNNGNANDSPPGNPGGRASDGLLVWTGPGNVLPPRCTIKFPNGSGKQVPFCNFNVFRGKRCHRPGGCRLLHISKLSDLAAADKLKFQTWVRETPNVEFAPGMGPTPGTANTPAAAPAAPPAQAPAPATA
jgi:hypothetical protein